jgi:RNA polymerase sigma-54 factor
VRPTAQGGWSVELNEAVLPRILVDRRYYAELSGARQAETKRFLDNCLSQATWLERSLDQRATTILKVAGEIVRHQDGFLAHGPSHLRPLGLKDVAAATGLHESTVSRTTANKFMATPRGTLPMRAFFSSALASTAGGEDHSAAAVKHRVRQLIEVEPAGAPLSDDAIAARLRREGIVIARRTVAKYREQSGIPASSARRRRVPA